MNRKNNTYDSLLSGVPLVTLRPITKNDLEMLRSWKTSHKEYFYHQDHINKEQQQSWFANYESREYDKIFIVVYKNVDIGCMGVRLKDDAWDVYNVILGIPKYGKKGIMSKALGLLVDYSKSIKNLPVVLEVLSDNPAIVWYQRNGFKIESETEKALIMKYSRND